MSDLDRMLERWTAAGLISADQARAIRATEKRVGLTSRAIPSIAEASHTSEPFLPSAPWVSSRRRCGRTSPSEPKWGSPRL